VASRKQPTSRKRCLLATASRILLWDDPINVKPLLFPGNMLRIAGHCQCYNEVVVDSAILNGRVMYSASRLESDTSKR
jgi:hypothetical protein